MFRRGKAPAEVEEADGPATVGALHSVKGAVVTFRVSEPFYTLSASQFAESQVDISSSGVKLTGV